MTKQESSSGHNRKSDGEGYWWLFAFCCLIAGLVCVICVAGCSVAAFGGAQDRCDRVASAMAAYETRCKASFVGSFPDCDSLLFGWVDADACESKLAGMACAGQPLPDECHLVALEGP